MSAYPIERRSFLGLLGAMGLGPAASETVDGEATTNSVAAQAESEPDARTFENELVVTYSDDTDLATVQAAAMRVVRANGERAHFGRVDESLGLVKITLGASTTAADRETIKDAIAEEPSVESVWNEHAVTRSYDVDDPRYPDQTNLQNVYAKDAWQSGPGRAQDMTIAIVEGKVKQTHEDLRDQFQDPPGFHPRFEIHQDPVETPWEQREPGNYAGQPVQGHATEVAGVAIAKHNNSKGIAGACQAGLINIISGDYSVSPVKTTMTDSLIATRYAVEKTDADVVNLSEGQTVEEYQNDVLDENPEIDTDVIVDEFEDWTGKSSQKWQKIVEIADRNQTVICTSAGNYSSDWDAEGRPASHPAEVEGIISVGATDDAFDMIESTADEEDIDVFAPVENVVTTGTRSDSRYKTIPGTEGQSSMATPVVSAVAAIVKNCHPNLSSPQIRDRIQQTGTTTSDQITVVNAATAASSPPTGAVLEEDISDVEMIDANPIRTSHYAGPPGGADPLNEDDLINHDNWPP